MSLFSRGALYFLLAAGLIIICAVSAPAQAVSQEPEVRPLTPYDYFSGAFGWASFDSSGTTNGTTGGYDADADHMYMVSNRNELIKALYPDAVIADDGSFSSPVGPDDSPKIILVSGGIDLSSSKAGKALGYEDFKDPEFDFEQYVETYKPVVWNIDPANWDTKKRRPLP
ncbi:MAG: hypothetical protein PVH22_15610, partial [Desulfobacteraceae bacterium]